MLAIAEYIFLHSNESNSSPFLFRSSSQIIASKKNNKIEIDFDINMALILLFVLCTKNKVSFWILSVFLSKTKYCSHVPLSIISSDNCCLNCF